MKRDLAGLGGGWRTRAIGTGGDKRVLDRFRYISFFVPIVPEHATYGL